VWDPIRGMIVHNALLELGVIPSQKLVRNAILDVPRAQPMAKLVLLARVHFKRIQLKELFVTVPKDI
jgi:hypothetical protein